MRAEYEYNSNIWFEGIFLNLKYVNLSFFITDGNRNPMLTIMSIIVLPLCTAKGMMVTFSISDDILWWYANEKSQYI